MRTLLFTKYKQSEVKSKIEKHAEGMLYFSLTLSECDGRHEEDF